VNETILAIDIGSTKTSAIIANINNQKVQILGLGEVPSKGIRKGTISNIDLASKSISDAVSDAKRVSGTSISNAIISISNAYAKSVKSQAIINLIKDEQNEITINTINRAIHLALYNAKISDDYEVVHILPYDFTIDEQKDIEDPFGMSASRLEVNVNIILINKSALSNIKRAIHLAGIEISNIVLSGYASSLSTLTPEEIQQGVAIIDMGGQTSDLVVNIHNSIQYNDFLGVGSQHITNDLSIALKTPFQIAENIKINYIDLKDRSKQTIKVPITGDEENTSDVSMDTVYNVVFARAEETLSLLAKSIEKSGLNDRLGAGIVLTGGMSKLKGIKELAQSVFIGLPVRLAYPNNIDGLYNNLKNPSYSTVIGLLLYKTGQHIPYEIDYNKQLLHSKDLPKEDLSDLKLHNEDKATSLEIELNSNSNNIIFDELDNKEDKIGFMQKLKNIFMHTF